VAARRLLVVEDDEHLRRTLVRCLVKEGCQVSEASDGREAVAKLEAKHSFDLVISDLEMPHADGREVVAAGVRARVPVVILTGNSSVTAAVELMKKGAANFITKPFTPALLRAVLDEMLGPTAPPQATAAVRPLIGTEAPLQRVIDAVQTVAETDATVLITGESGTGKELVARTIHAASRRAAKPFVAVNCGAIPEALLESELFGHAKGAFTGATHSRAGRFQLAEGGTLLLDEVGDMPLAFQVKLLRVLQERQFEVLGEGTVHNADVRVIAATHRDLKRMTQAGTFREDLRYRLNVVEIQLPPLRERRADIPLLVQHFIDAANARHRRSVSGAASAVFDAFAAYSWPGNVRELANVVERMVIFRRQGELAREDLPEGLGDAKAVESARTVTAELPAEGVNLRQMVVELEDSLIAQALARTGGNRKAAADLLGLNRTTLVERLRKK